MRQQVKFLVAFSLDPVFISERKPTIYYQGYESHMENGASTLAPVDFRNFFRTFNELLSKRETDESRWKSFVNKLRTFHDSQLSQIPPRPETKKEDFIMFFKELKTPLEKHYKNGFGINVWNVAGIGNDEMRNSAILAWLLDCKGSHGQKNLFLEGLLNLLAQDKDIRNTTAISNLPLPGSTGNSHYWTKVESHYWTQLEPLPLCAQGNRVDIEIDGPFLLFIEVKINAPETNNQLERYVELARKKAGSRKWGVLLLTKDKSRPKDANLHDHVVSISWKQLTASIMKQAESNMPKDSFGFNVISQFCQHLTT